METLILYKHLGEMRQTMLHDGEMSHISDMHMRCDLLVTTLRSACMVLIASVDASHASGTVS